MVECIHDATCLAGMQQDIVSLMVKDFLVKSRLGAEGDASLFIRI